MRYSLMVLLVLWAACEHGIDLRGQVTVPAEVLRGLSPEHPAELIVKAALPTTREQQSTDFPIHGVALCFPSQGDRVVPVSSFRFACADNQNAQVTAWVVPRAPTEVSCLGEPPPHSRRFDPAQGTTLAQGHVSAKVEVDAYTDVGCKKGLINFELTLAPR